jgi:hypothetical protein
VVCSGHCIALHRGARRAGLQAWRERRPGLQVPEVLIEASANIVARAESVRVIAVRRRVSSLRLGGRPSFHRPRRGRFTGVPHYSPTCVGMASSATELTTVLANLIPVTASWRALCPNRSGFEGGGVAVGCLAVVHGQARGGSSTEARTRHSSRYGDVLPPCVPTVSGVSLQYAAWRCSDGDGRTKLTATGMATLAGLTSWRSPVWSRKEHSRVPPAPFEGSAR